MNRRKIIWIITGALFVFLGAYIIKTDLAIAPSQDVSPETSGIRATVTLGPTCPVERIPPDGTCGDKPYQADFKITPKGTLFPFSRTVSSDAGGKFTIELPPGEYTVTPTLKAVMPRASAQDVTVTPGHITKITIMFDSGIR